MQAMVAILMLQKIKTFTDLTNFPDGCCSIIGGGSCMVRLIKDGGMLATAPLTIALESGTRDCTGTGVLPDPGGIETCAGPGHGPIDGTAPPTVFREALLSAFDAIISLIFCMAT